MSGIFDAVLGAAGGGAISQLGAKFGLDNTQARSAVQNLLPALTRGVSKNMKKPGGVESLLGALKGGNHTRYVEQPELLGTAETESEGNAILGHLLGSKDVSRRVAKNASARSGVDEGILKKMLPNVAAMAMGAMGKESSGGALSGLMGMLGGGGGGGAAGLLSSFLGGGKDDDDDDDDGFGLGDALNIAKKLF